jgi:hypothetical protein
MRVFYDLQKLPAFRNAVVTIGSFDGVHCGHQKILEQVNNLAYTVQGESIVITFNPHPRQIIYPQDNTLRLLTTTAEKIALLGRYAVDNVVVVPFTVEFSQISADEYIETFLVGKFQPKYIVIGYDHRFGLNRQGDIHFLKWYAKKYNYEVIEIEKQEVDDIAVSSTKIRNALEKSDVKAATQLLGHYYTLNGIVVKGQQIGRTIGFPTANVQVQEREKLIPPDGIYAVRVTHDRQIYSGMLYIGTRPVLKEYHNRTIEVNIFDFDKKIYGDFLRLELVDFIRADANFTSLEALQQQLKKDQQAAQTILQTVSNFNSNLSIQTAIVILNYNGKHYLEQFLPIVIKHSPNAAVIIADNGSTDDSVPFLQTHFPDIRLLIADKNHGFAGGYNVALQKLINENWKYYILLNSDVEVTKGWLEPLVAMLEKDETVAAVQPKIRAFAQKTHFEYAGAAGGWLDALGYPFCRGRIFAVTEADEGQYDDAQEIFWATGAAMLVRAGLFHALQGFDADYFAHLEEIDLCWRLKRTGYKIMVEPKSIVYHVGGGTLSYNTPFKSYLNFRNSLYTIVKNEPVVRLIWLLPVRLLLDGVAGLLFLKEGKFEHLQSIVRAHWTFFPNFIKTLHKRKTIQQNITTIQIGKFTVWEGRFRGSIVWRYYILGRKFYKDLEKK